MSKKVVKKSPIDSRDHIYKATDTEAFLPESYLDAGTKVRCQGTSSQCVAYACTQAMSQLERLKTGIYNLYSPGLLYANREEDDYQGEGWWVRKGLKQLQKYGTCLEKDFPHPESYKTERKKFLADKENLLKKAAEHKINSYFRCTTEKDIKRCIMEHGCVITSATIPWYALFKHSFTKKNYPTKGGSGHAFILVGWDKDGWIAQDSYSLLRPWFGLFHLSYDYPLDEFWGID